MHFLELLKKKDLQVYGEAQLQQFFELCQWILHNWLVIMRLNKHCKGYLIKKMIQHKFDCCHQHYLEFLWQLYRCHLIISRQKWWKCQKVKRNNLNLDKEGVFPYSGFFDCIRKSIKNEGFTALWVGIGTYYMRIAPHAMITVLAQDFFHDLLKGS
jgi:hypothetical protein